MKGQVKNFKEMISKTCHLYKGHQIRVENLTNESLPVHVEGNLNSHCPAKHKRED